MHRNIVVVAIGLSLGAALEGHAQSDTTLADSLATRVQAILARRDTIEKVSKTFRFGLSVGWRHLLAGDADIVRHATINPADTTVAIDNIDKGSLLLSGVVVAFPWTKGDDPTCCGKRTNLWRLGFIANIDIATFGGESTASFNKSIEGGLGLTYKLATDFAFAVTFERVFSRRLLSFVKEGDKLRGLDGTTVTRLSVDDNTYFRDDNFSALSFKFVYFIR